MVDGEKPIAGRLAQIETAYWRRKARRLHVPFPERQTRAVAKIGELMSSSIVVEPNDDNWGVIESVEYGERFWHLTDAGIFRLRALIREEQKARRDSRVVWITATGQIIAAITGVLGASIRLLSFHRFVK